MDISDILTPLKLSSDVECCTGQALQGSRQQRAGANRRAGIAEENTDEEMGEEAEQEGDSPDGQGGSPRAGYDHDTAMDSFVASLLQRTSLDGTPGAPPLLHAMILLIEGWRVPLQWRIPLICATVLARSLSRLLSCIAATGQEAEEGAGEVSEEEAAALRAQMEELLRQPTAAGSPDDADTQYGRDMWARCEALTAGSLLTHATWPGTTLVGSAHM